MILLLCHDSMDASLSLGRLLALIPLHDVSEVASSRSHQEYSFGVSIQSVEKQGVTDRRSCFSLIVHMLDVPVFERKRTQCWMCTCSARVFLMQWRVFDTTPAPSQLRIKIIAEQQEVVLTYFEKVLGTGDPGRA